jgi:uncharacterized paraquat-inducible protein A
MNAEQQVAFEWAKNQNFQSAAARYAKTLADLIDALQAQLAEYEALAAEYGIDGQTMLTLAKSQIATAADNVKLMEQLTASQRREKAARNELCQKCGRYHEAHKGACDGCRWKGESNA